MPWDDTRWQEMNTRVQDRLIRLTRVTYITYLTLKTSVTYFTHQISISKILLIDNFESSVFVYCWVQCICLMFSPMHLYTVESVVYWCQWHLVEPAQSSHAMLASTPYFTTLPHCTATTPYCTEARLPTHKQYSYCRWGSKVSWQPLHC